LQRAHELLSGLDSWDTASIHAAIEKVTVQLDVGMGKVGQPLRVAVTGGSFSPPIDQTLELLGRQRSLLRIQRAIDHVSALARP
jgi:glutamyl-tRNA synthetase